MSLKEAFSQKDLPDHKTQLEVQRISVQQEHVRTGGQEDRRILGQEDIRTGGQENGRTRTGEQENTIKKCFLMASEVP